MFKIKIYVGGESERDQSLALTVMYLDARKAARHETRVKTAANT